MKDNNGVNGNGTTNGGNGQYNRNNNNDSIVRENDNDDEDLKYLMGKKSTTTTQYYDNRGAPSICSLISGYIQYHLHSCCYFYPISCGVLSILIVGITLWLVLGSLINPTVQYGIKSGHDHSDITSNYDLQLQKIDHYCLGGNKRSADNDCTCEDPLQPSSRAEHTSWVLAYKSNRRKIDQNYIEKNKNPDVAFVGGSIVEEMEGRWLGISGRTVGLKKLSSIYQHHFSVDNFPAHAKVDGITLGIAGDTSPNVLWRLMHGEMPDDFNPKIWWLVLGMNDLARTKCSEEVVLLGIFRVVEEILEHKPNAHIVINSLLPMTVLRGDDYPVISDVKDSFTKSEAETTSETTSSSGNSRYRQLQSTTNTKPKATRTVKQSENDAEEVKKIKDLESKAEKEERIRDQIQIQKLKMMMMKRRGDGIQYANTNIKRPQVLVDKTKIKKFKPGHIRKNTIPLWTSIKAINAALARFAEKHKNNVSFFDATSIFVEQSTNRGIGKKTKTILRADRTSSKGHPTISGFFAFEDKIAFYLEKLLADLHFDKKDPPELHHSHDELDEPNYPNDDDDDIRSSDNNDGEDEDVETSKQSNSKTDTGSSAKTTAGNSTKTADDKSSKTTDGKATETTDDKKATKTTDSKSADGNTTTNELSDDGPYSDDIGFSQFYDKYKNDFDEMEYPEDGFGSDDGRFNHDDI